MSPARPPLEQVYSSRSPLRTWGLLLNRSWYFYLWVLFVFCVKHASFMIVPVLVARAVDTLSDPVAYPLGDLVILLIVSLVLLAINIPVHTYFIYLISDAVRAMEQALRRALTIRLQQLSIAFHDRIESGRLQAKILRDVEQIQQLSMILLEAFLGAAVTIAYALILTAAKEPWMLLFYLLLSPLAVLVVHVFKGRIRERNRAYRSQVETMSAHVSEMIDMIPVARAHGVEEQAMKDATTRFQHVHEKGVALDWINALFQSSAWVTFRLTIIGGVAGAFVLCWKGYISVGDVVLYQSLFMFIMMSVNQVLGFLPNISRGFESIRSIGEVLECPDVEENQGKRAVERVAGRIAFDHVDFAYPDSNADAVTDITLRIDPGECVAFVGASGAGKSTLIGLVIGFLRPTAGRMVLDGLNMDEIDMRTFRRHLSVVPQETMLFSGSIRENITYGLADLPEDWINEAVRMANLEDVVAQAPQGLDTQIGEGGVMLSGGQRQRVAIARAIVRDPRILILDEATSSLDVASEMSVQEAIERVRKGRTTLIVAHRLSTIRHADRVVVLEAGRCVEDGTYDELIERGGYFARMIRLQGVEPVTR